MSDFSPFTLNSQTGTNLAVRHIEAEGQARGAVQINHGLAEHSARYERFARFLSARGYHVYAHDHRGHGATRAPDAMPGAFASKSKDGVGKVLADVAAVHALIHKNHPELPVVAFGHSMGGLIALNYAQAMQSDLAGLAVWNSNFNAGVLGRVGQGLLAVEAFFKGSDTPSAILPKLTFETWAKAMPGRRTDFDWLSRDEAEVDAYVADPLCGWDATVGMWQAVFRMIFAGGGLANLKRLPRDLPIHLIGGAADPATDNGKAVNWLGEQMRKAKLTDVTVAVLPDTRHETLNEINRDQSMAEFADWLDRAVGA